MFRYRKLYLLVVVKKGNRIVNMTVLVFINQIDTKCSVEARIGVAFIYLSSTLNSLKSRPAQTDETIQTVDTSCSVFAWRRSVSKYKLAP